MLYIENNDFAKVIDFAKSQMIDLINQGKYDNLYKAHIKEIILLIADKHFPSNWPELADLIRNLCEANLDHNISEQNEGNNIDILINLSDLFYSLLKQQNKKRVPQTRQKFLQYKNIFSGLFLPFYSRIISFFNENSANFKNLNFIQKYISLMMHNDKILLILIDCTFSISDFHKDETLFYMLSTILERAYIVLNQILNNPLEEIKDLLHKNIYKIIRILSKIQTTSAIIFYRDLDKYVNMLLLVLVNCNVFMQECIKVVFFALYKILNTQSYKEMQPDDFKLTVMENPQLLAQSNTTPEKNQKSKKIGYVNFLVSPTKYKNHETQLVTANEIFSSLFKEELVRNLIDTLIKKVPFIYKKETENIEIDVLADIEEDIVPTDTFNSNTMSWQMLYKNLLSSILENFNSISVKYIKDILEQLYQTEGNISQNIQNLDNTQLSNVNNYNFNILLIDSVISLVNLVPHLYKNGTINEVDMIDFRKFIAFVELMAGKSEVILKRYIITVNKWADVLISNDLIFNYF
jgi:hypothetical protein